MRIKIVRKKYCNWDRETKRILMGTYCDACVMIYVRRSCRKNGIGRKLLNRITKYNKRFATYGWSDEAEEFFRKVRREIKRNDEELKMIVY